MPDYPALPTDFDLLRTYAIVKVPPEATFSFEGSDADILFREDIDHFNFSEVAPGTSWGKCPKGARLRLEFAHDVEAKAPDYFDYSDEEIRIAEPAIPAMLTRDRDAVRADYLCYLMRRIEFDGQSSRKAHRA